MAGRSIRRLPYRLCTSARTFAPRLLQTPPRGDALVLRYPSPLSGWDGTYTHKLPNMIFDPARRTAKRPGTIQRRAFSIDRGIKAALFLFVGCDDHVLRVAAAIDEQ